MHEASIKIPAREKVDFGSKSRQSIVFGVEVICQKLWPLNLFCWNFPSCSFLNFYFKTKFMNLSPIVIAQIAVIHKNANETAVAVITEACR